MGIMCTKEIQGTIQGGNRGAFGSLASSLADTLIRTHVH